MEAFNYKFIIIFVFVLLLLILPKLHKFFTVTLNLKLIFKHLSNSLSIVKENKLILIVPIILSICNYLFKVLEFFYKQSLRDEYSYLDKLTESSTKIEIPPLDFNIVINTFKNSLLRIADPYPGIINGVFFISTVIIIIYFYKYISRKLHTDIHNENYNDGINLFIKVLKITSFVLFPFLLLFLYTVFTDTEKIYNYFPIFIFVTLLSSLAILTVIQSLIYFLIINYHNETTTDLSKLRLMTFSNFRNFFSYNIYFLILWSIPSFFSIIASIATMLNININKNILMTLNEYLNLPVKIIAFFLLFIPIIILDKQIIFSKAIYINIKIIKQYFIDYCFLFIFGIIFLAIPYFLLNLISHYYQLLGNWSIILNIIVKPIEVTFSALYYLIIIEYLIKNKYYKSLIIN